MTYEEALHEISTKVYRNTDDFEMTISKDCYKKIIDALEKQIPKKHIENIYPWCICPNCGGSVYVKHIQEHIQNGEQTYCEHCGQALDWSDME